MPYPHSYSYSHSYRRSLAALVLLLLPLLPACADLPPVASHVCGNGVVDPHEDCDTFPDPALGEGTQCGAPSDSTRACRYVCSQTQPCPTGWACGGDGICRYSSGSFVSTPDSPLRMATDHIAAARFDRDAYPDLLGLDGASVELRVGGLDGRFLTSAQLSVDFPTGDLAVGDLDQDQRADLVLPIYDGLFVMRGGAQGTLEPVAYSPIVIPAIDQGVQVLPVKIQDGVPFDAELLLDAGCALFDYQDPTLGCDNPFFFLPPGKLTRDLVGRVARANLQGGDAEEIAFAFAGDEHVYLYRIVDDDPDPSHFTPRAEQYETISLGQPVGPYGVAFADLDGDGDLDLYASVGDVDTDQVVVAFNQGGHFASATGQIDRTSPEPWFDCASDSCACPSSGCEPSGHRRHWPLAMGRLDGDKIADAVMPDGIYIRVGNNVNETVYAFGPQNWSAAEIADLNRDGLNDVSCATGENRGIDFYTGTGTGLFNRSHVDTTDVPVVLRSGDFDGDLVNDLAIGERGASPGHDDDTVSVLYGRLQGAPLPPVSMGRLRHIEVMEPAHLDDYRHDQIGDLLVLSNGGSGSTDRSLARLVGSAQRRLISPFRLPAPSTDFEQATGVLIGHYAGDDSVPDLFVPGSASLWVVKGGGDARFDAEDARAIPLGPPLFGSGPGQLSTDIFCNLWTTGDLDGDGTDEVIAVDRRFNYDCGVETGDLTGASKLLVAKVQNGSMLSGHVFDLPATTTGPRQLLLADVDADQHLDLVVVFGGAVKPDDPTFSSENYGVLVFWGLASGDGFDISAPAVVPALPDQAIPSSAAAINADGDKQRELAVASDVGVYLVDLDVSTRKFAAPVLAIPEQARDIVSTDVNADGLDDLIFADRDGTQVFVYTASPSLFPTASP